MNAPVRFAAVLAALVLGLSNAAAQTERAPQIFATHGIGPLKDIVTTGDVEGWKGWFDRGVYWMENSRDAGAVRYYYITTEGAPNDREISVDISLSITAPESRAGLLYGYAENPRRYYMIVVGSNRQLDVYSRDQGGFRRVMSSSIDPSATGFANIMLKTQGQQVRVAANGREVGSFNSPGSGPGGVGIAAFGTGRFGFTNFRQAFAGAGGQTPPPSAQQRPPQQFQTAPPPQQQPYQPAPPGQTQPYQSAPPPYGRQGAAPGSRPAPQTALGRATAFKEHAVRDASRGNFPAFNVLVPQGWSFESQLKMVPAYNMLPYIGSFTAKAPDGRHVSFAPFSEFGYSDLFRGQPMQPYEGRPYLRKPRSLGEALVAIARLDPKQTMTNIEIVSEDVLPGATDMMRRNSAAAYRGAQDYNRQWGMTGERFTYNVDVRRVVMRFTENGKRLESTLFAVVGSSVITLPNGAVKTAMWNLTDAYSVGGPAGSPYMNDPVLAAVVRSKRMNPDWAYAIDQWYKGRREQIVREGAARAAAAQRAWQNTRGKRSESVLDISFNGWKRRNAMTDKGHSNYINSIHQRTTYATPSGGRVNLPSFYRHVYTDGQGNYVLHNDSNYNINTDPAFNRRNWQRMPQAR